MLCILGEVDPVGGKAQPIILIQLADRPLGLLAKFLSFLAEPICIGVGHGDEVVVPDVTKKYGICPGLVNL